ncbi:MAG: DNA translocase FtsK 4TM domain-containing protein [Pseudomonadota bacterium]|nr:DNA translocase FtsK 4TM domain-containing protein [Pseudomonadota bacterium]
MPQAKRKKKKPQKTPKKRSMSPRVAAALREIALISIGLLVVYLLVSLLTYSQQDPGPSNSLDRENVANLGGRVGAWFADFMFTGFGHSAYLFVLLLIGVGWRIFREKEPTAVSLAGQLLPVAGLVFAMAGATGLEHIYFYEPSVSQPFVAGGILGDVTSNWFLGNFGDVGTTVVFLVLFITGVTLATHLSWFSVMDRIGYRAFRGVDWLRTRAMEMLDRFKGARSRKQRTESVREIRKELKKKKPPRIEPKVTTAKISKRDQRERQTSLFREPRPEGALPAISLLDPPATNNSGYSKDELNTMSRLLVKKLKDFNIDATVEAVLPGPVITRFEIELAPGIKASQIVGLSRDLARALSVVSVRVVENIPGKTVIGIEVPNESREIVYFVEGIASEEYDKNSSPLALVMGKDISGNPVIADLTKFPHVLIAGATGAGKSVCINAFILSILYKSTPDQVRMIMVDPKMLELSVYDGIPHLLAPVVTDMKKAANALFWCIAEMDRRFRLMAALGVRNIGGYNRKVKEAADKGEPILDPLAEPDAEGQVDRQPLESLPYIVVVVDELADLMMVVGKKIEEIITRIAQRARAAGIHLVLATQRPSVDVVTGLIKANVPTRVAFQVSSRADSRTVLDQMGAEQLLGHGDMLFLPPGTGFPVRVHGSFVSDQEVHRVVEALKQSGRPVYLDEVTEGSYESGDGGSGSMHDDDGEADPLYDRAVQFVTETRRASISAVQRHLRVGYNRAARMIDSMEESGVVGSSENGKREVLAPPPRD